MERGVESIGWVRKADKAYCGEIATREGGSLTLRAPDGSDDALRGCGALNEPFVVSSESP
jgi:hypothetical protein